VNAWERCLHTAGPAGRYEGGEHFQYLICVHNDDSGDSTGHNSANHEGTQTTARTIAGAGRMAR
jgi:hypothetical protein